MVVFENNEIKIEKYLHKEYINIYVIPKKDYNKMKKITIFNNKNKGVIL